MIGEEPIDDDLLAAELAFGLLDTNDRNAAEQRLVEPGFRRLHARWQEHALALLAGGDVVPPSQVWDEIRQALPANTNGIAGQLRGWRIATFVVSAAALALAAVAVKEMSALPPPPAPHIAPSTTAPLLAILRSDTGRAVVALSYDRTTRRIAATTSGVTIGRRAAELWVIPAGGKPISLGLIAPTGVRVIAPPQGGIGNLLPGSQLAVSSEPAGGSPNGQPTGPIIASGALLASST